MSADTANATATISKSTTNAMVSGRDKDVAAARFRLGVVHPWRGVSGLTERLGCGNRRHLLFLNDHHPLSLSPSFKCGLGTPLF